MSAAVETLRRWKRSTAAFARECCGYEPDAWQLKVFRDFDSPVDSSNPPSQRVAMQACAGPGKTRGEATIGWKFLVCHGGPGAHPNGFALSISGDNLKDNLWKEMAVLRNESPILQQMFEWTSEKIYNRDYPDTWWIKARSYSKSADPETQGNALSGLHAKNILYLIDEAGEISPAVLRKAEQGLSNCEFGKIVMAGNPTSTTGALYHAVANQASLWSVTRITGDPDDPGRSPRIDIEWARSQIALYGRDNPWVQAYILGQFPAGGLNTLLTPDEVRTSMNRNPTPDQYDWAQKRLGIDVARFGDDRTVIFPRQGMVAFRPIVLRKLRTDFITAQVLNVKRSFQSEIDFIDDTGHWGHGVVDGLLSAGQGAQAIIFSDPAINPRYYNRRTEMLFGMADWVKDRGALPNMPELIEELTHQTYGFKNGKILCTEKDLIKATLGRSPDLADALALTWALPDMPGSGADFGSGAGRGAVRDYNPHAGLPTG